MPFISVDGGRYGLPPGVLGQLVEIRRPVDSNEFTVGHAGRVIVTHTLNQVPGPDIIWRSEHRAQVEAIALAGRTKTDNRHLHLVTPPAIEAPVEQLELGVGDYDVDPPDLAERYGIDIDADGEPA